MLYVHNLCIGYKTNKTLINNFTLDLNSGEIVAMIGSSGSGKTTILKAIAGLIPINSGAIVLDGVSLNDKDKQTTPEHRNVGMVFQDYGLFPHFSVVDNIAFGLNKLNKNQKKQRILELLNLIDLPDIGQKYPHQLSGGQQQRVALARSLATNPKLLLLDEPFSNLDNKHKTQLIKQVRLILKKKNMSTIVVTHNKLEAKLFADRIIYLKEGV